MKGRHEGLKAFSHPPRRRLIHPCSFVLSIEDTRNNRDAVGRDGPSHVAFVMEGGGASKLVESW
jgi:hypothetical protein